MKITSNTTLIVIGALIVAAGAYWYFFTGTGNEIPLTSLDASTNQEQTQFQALVNELQPISFNTDILSDPRFNVLVDLRTPVIPESVGRLDPFAPITSTNRK